MSPPWALPPWAMFRRWGLRELVLRLLHDRPMTGAEVIRAIEELTWGIWRPSPGSVYPLLKQLEAEGLVRRGEDGRYFLTEAGKGVARGLWPRWPLWPRPGYTVEEVVEELESLAMYLEDLARTEPDKVSPFKDRVRAVVDRLRSIT